MRIRRRRIAPLVLALLAVLLGPGIARAGAAAKASAGTTVTTGTWSLVFTPYASGRAATGAQGAVTVSLGGDSFVYMTNNGTLALGANFAYTLSMTATGSAAGQVERCDTGWDPSTDTCPNSGNVTAVAHTGRANSVTLISTLQPGDWRVFRIHPTSAVAGDTATVGVTVTKN